MTAPVVAVAMEVGADDVEAVPVDLFPVAGAAGERLSGLWSSGRAVPSA
ncbi:hypothetical protein ACFCXA_03980 [Streptomyces virginiae]